MQQAVGIAGARTVLIVALLALAASVCAAGTEPAPGNGDDKLFDVAIRVGGNTTLFRYGDYYRGTSTAFGYDADIVVPLSRKVALVATAGRAGIKVETDPTIISKETVTNYIYRGYDVTASRYSISAQYGWDWLFRRLAKNGLGRTIIGVSLGLGAITHKQSVTSVMYPDDGPALSDTQTKFALTIGFSYTQMLGGRIGLHVLDETDIVFLGSQDDAEVHWKENGGVAFLDHLRFGLTVAF